MEDLYYEKMLEEVYSRIDNIPCIMKGYIFKTQEDAEKIKDKLKEINMAVEVMEGMMRFKNE